MPSFSYTALKRDGSVTSGELTANDRSEALRRIERGGMQPVNVKVKEEGAAGAGSAKPAAAPKAKEEPKAAKSAGGLALAAPAGAGKGNPALEKRDKDKERGGSSAVQHSSEAMSKGEKLTAASGPVKMKRKDVILFTEEMSDLLAAGLQLEPALKIMESRDELSATKDVCTIIRAKIRDGSSFSNALRSSSTSFGDLYCNLAAAGEISGALPKILRRQSEYLVSLQTLQNKVTLAMIYPMCLIVAGLSVCTLFVSYLIPQLAGLLKTMGKELPLPAKIAMGFGNFVTTWWWAIALVTGLAVWGFQRITNSPTYKQPWHKKVLELPFIGPLASQRFFVQFLETLSNLVGNGLPLLRALELTRDATINLHLKALLSKVIGMVGEGGSLSRSLKKVGFFPSLLTDMITVGEQTGDLEHALERTAVRYDKELQKTIDRGTALITPVIIFIMAIIVGTMAWLMVSVILQSVTSIKR